MPPSFGATIISIGALLDPFNAGSGLQSSLFNHDGSDRVVISFIEDRYVVDVYDEREVKVGDVDDSSARDGSSGTTCVRNVFTSVGNL